MSRVKKATFTPAYRMDRLERFARGGLGLDEVRRTSSSVIEVEQGDRLYKIKVAGRTTVKVTAYVDQIPDAELIVSDERAEAVLIRVAGRSI